jgi:hypothetical protein
MSALWLTPGHVSTACRVSSAVNAPDSLFVIMLHAPIAAVAVVAVVGVGVAVDGALLMEADAGALLRLPPTWVSPTVANGTTSFCCCCCVCCW